jgi:predicted small lipoprotein YifL
MKRSVAVAMLLALVTLAACGRPGPIRPPGPPDQVTSGRAYPSR